jgi:C2 domain
VKVQRNRKRKRMSMTTTNHEPTTTTITPMSSSPVVPVPVERTKMTTTAKIYIDIESATLNKIQYEPLNTKMDPFVKVYLLLKSSQEEQQILLLSRTSTHWNGHLHPTWHHSCPPLTSIVDGDVSDVMVRFEIYNDSESRLHKPNLMACHTVALQNLSHIIYDEKEEETPDNTTAAAGASSIRRLPLLHPKTNELIGDLKCRFYKCVTETNKSRVQVNNNIHSSPMTHSFNQGVGVTENEAVGVIVHPSWFESPVYQLHDKSGGTAPFFHLKLTQKGMIESTSTQHKARPGGMNGISFYIGKDLSHAEEEEGFYNRVLQLRKTVDEEAAQLQDDTTGGVITWLLPYMLDYLGVLKIETMCAGNTQLKQKQEEEVETRSLLVIENLRNNYHQFRMADIKIGERTAQSGWKGKSKRSAWKQHMFDNVTNSLVEGYRLVGMDGPSPVLESIDPWIDAFTNTPQIGRYVQHNVDENDLKKAKRLLLQRMKGKKIFRHLIDLHAVGSVSAYAEEETTTIITSAEVAEIVLHHISTCLVDLAVSCHCIEIPQKWIGSSVAIGLDVGLRPQRSVDAELYIRSKVIVKIFDWGRSELLTRNEYRKLTKDEQEDRWRFWNYYRGGMDKLAYAACHAYEQQFSITDSTVDNKERNRWIKISIKVMDFDSMSSDDYMGECTVALPDPFSPSDSSKLRILGQTSKYAIKSHTSSGSQKPLLVGHNANPMMLHCNISWRDFPAESRLRGSWKIVIEKATDLPIRDVKKRSSDPYCIVSAIDRDGHIQFVQQTCVKIDTLNPTWNETFDVPVVRCRRSHIYRTLDDVPISNESNSDNEGIFSHSSKSFDSFSKRLILAARNRMLKQ